MTTEERNAKIRELQRTMQYAYALGEELGCPNVLEKAKWKELVVGMILGDTVFTKSTGDVKGADAQNDESGEFREYKTTELQTEKTFNRFMESAFDENSSRTYSGSMTYNGSAGTEGRKTVNSYKAFGHLQAMFHKGECVAITRVNTDYVTGDNGLMKRVIKEEEGKKYKSTNGNSVSVHYENGGAREGEVVYRNDIRK
jgi:hypothetical protein